MTENLKQKIEEHVSPSAFEERYYRVLEELKALDSGTFDDTEAKALAAACLRTQVIVSKLQTEADARAKMLKKDVDFEKASVYLRMKKNPPKDLKLTDEGLKQAMNADDKVLEIIKEQIEAEKEAKDLSNLLNILANAHVTFREIFKKGD